MFDTKIPYPKLDFVYIFFGVVAKAAKAERKKITPEERPLGLVYVV